MDVDSLHIYKSLFSVNQVFEDTVIHMFVGAFIMETADPETTSVLRLLQL